MSSFLEKLKKGMKTQSTAEEQDNGPDEDVEEKEETEKEDEKEEEEREKEEEREEEEEEAVEDEPIEEAPKLAKSKRVAAKKPKAAPAKLENLEVKAIPAANEEASAPAAESNDEWLETEGQLAVDVYQTENELVIQSAIAGIKTEDLDVLVEDDVLTIKGTRLNPYQADSIDYFIQECYWGPFSRKIILPVEVDASRTDASMKDGILTIRLPKIQREKKKKITIKS